MIKKFINTLTINNFKLNKAPALAKILSLADLKGLTDTLKGDGISFDTLSIKYETNPMTMTINEIFYDRTFYICVNRWIC